MTRSKKHAKSTKQPGGNSKSGDARSEQKRADWRRRYCIPPDNILRAARDLIYRSTPTQIDDFAGRMFALQDLIDNEELDKIALIEKESDEPAFIEIVKAVRREAELARDAGHGPDPGTGADPEYARSIAGEFIDSAFRMDSETLPVWFRYQNRIRQRRIDSGYGLIDPPDESTGTPNEDSHISGGGAICANEAASGEVSVKVDISFLK
ncbi:MAG TPA: hypothetical protein VEZ90_10655 [Blastocatellia bacterium]|nr:hypothetical protein [Blastocatellia bacterium]